MFTPWPRAWLAPHRMKLTTPNNTSIQKSPQVCEQHSPLTLFWSNLPQSQLMFQATIPLMLPLFLQVRCPRFCHHRSHLRINKSILFPFHLLSSVTLPVLIRQVLHIQPHMICHWMIPSISTICSNQISSWISLQFFIILPNWYFITRAYLSSNLFS